MAFKINSDVSLNNSSTAKTLCLLGSSINCTKQISMSYIESSFLETQAEIKKHIVKEIPSFYEISLNSDSYNSFITNIEDNLKNRISILPSKNIHGQQEAISQMLLLLNNEGHEFEDPNRNNQKFKSQPFYWLWQTMNDENSYATNDFFDDMLSLIKRAFSEVSIKSIGGGELLKRMTEIPKAMDSEVIKRREASKLRVMTGLVSIIENSKNIHKIYHFTDEVTFDQKLAAVSGWWNDYRFHLRYAIQSLEQLRLTTNNQLPKSVMRNFENGVAKGIPIFINPYYLSLVHIGANGELCADDRTIRDYIFNSKDLVDTFGKIKAWEKEDIIEDGKPNAAGWLLPEGDSVHRRYPEVAIFIPEGRGRACAGLCVSCQRMYGFQKGSLNFDLEKMDKKADKSQQRQDIFNYFENDSHLQDILITGGDSFMNTDARLKTILDDFYEVVKRKKLSSENQPDNEKVAMFQRVRLGTRILAYLPQRVGHELVKILKEFKAKAVEVGIKQFVIQTHFETAMELTPEAIKTIEMLRESGWIIVNQQVYTAAASRRSHSMQLRRELNKLGVLPYYTFAVKGFKENRENFTPLARVAQEVYEEKVYGKPKKDRSIEFHSDPKNNHLLFRQIEEEENLPFVATDRSLLNLPALGKSLSFHQVGITMDGRRVLSFEHDKFRNHSPVVHHSERVIIVEAKSIACYLRQLESMGEDIVDYNGIYSYSNAETERRSEVFEYPKFDFSQATDYNNCEMN